MPWQHGAMKIRGATVGCWVRTLRHVPLNRLVYKAFRRAKWAYYSSALYAAATLVKRQAAVDTLGVFPELPQLWGGEMAKGAELAAGRWHFVGKTQPVREPVDWAPEPVSDLWRFHLHYHDWIGDLRAAGKREVAQKLVADWLEQCGHFHAIGWHPYPLSLRIVNWLVHGRWLLAGWEAKHQLALREVLVAQVDFLASNMEWDLGYNHLLKNIKALVFAGVALPECEKHFVPALAMLLREVQKQVLPDGCHVERSPSYHRQVLQDLIDVAAVLKTRGGAPVALTEAIERMAGALQMLRHPDGGLALFNDGETESPAFVDSVVRHGLGGDVPQVLPDAGFVRLQRGAAVVLADVGRIMPDDNPGHAHAETMSFEFSYGGERLLVNGGTFGYQHAKRNVYRGTMMHNTLSLDGADMAEVWGSFRVGRRPRRVAFEGKDIETPGADAVLEGLHDGWRAQGVIHHRKWVLSADGSRLRGMDVLECKKDTKARVLVAFMVHPAVQVQLIDDKMAELKSRAGEVWRLEIKEGRLDCRDVMYAPHFGEAQAAKQLVLVAPLRGKGTLSLDWRLVRTTPAA